MAANTWANIGLIVAREYRERVRKRSFAVATAAIAILALAGTFAPAVIQAIGQGDAQTRLVVLNSAGPVAGMEPPALVAYLDSSLNARGPEAKAGKPPFIVAPAAPADAAVLEKQVREHTLDSVLVIGRGADGDVTFRYTTKREGQHASSVQLRQTLNALAASDRLQRAGLSVAQQQQAFRPADFKLVSTSNNTFNNGKSVSENLTNYAITTAMVVLLFTMIAMYGGWIAGGVVEEKSTRIMEIMINAATPEQLMAGKILGVGAAALTQMGALIVPALVGILLQGPVNQLLLGTSTPEAVTITGASVSLLLWSGLFFLLGFALYGALYAGLGSLVSRPEEVSQAVAPLQFVLLPGYILGVAALPAINEPWVRGLSFVPLFTPTLMIARIGVGQVAAWEILLAVALLLVSIVAAVLVAARLYRNGVLHYGQRLGVLAVLRGRNPRKADPTLEAAPR
ncbi:MAG TPA: ABC transporter permease [Chloroflexia bacterium]|nr:ABC transporter permease [Chloroflexia bacterium]